MGMWQVTICVAGTVFNNKGLTQNYRARKYCSYDGQPWGDSTICVKLIGTSRFCNSNRKKR